MAGRIGTLIPDTIRIQDDTILVPVAFATEIKGGLHAVNTVVLRDAIPTYYRAFGMLCSVTADGTPANNKIYRLWPNIDSNVANNANWESLSALTTPSLQSVTESGAVTTLSVTTAGITNTGSITNTGYITNIGKFSTGFNNSTDGVYATAIGIDAQSSHPGEVVIASGYVNNPYDTLNSFLILKAQTSGAVLQKLFMGRPATPVYDIEIAFDSRTVFRLTFIVADLNDSSKVITGYVYYQVSKLLTNLSVNVSGGENPTILVPILGMPNPPALVADTTTGKVSIKGQGVIAKNYYWAVTVEKLAAVTVLAL